MLPATLGELRSGAFGQDSYRTRTVKDEMRSNLIRALRDNRPVFPGIVGYEETVVPQVVNAILSRHNMILLGLRGQAKSRILRGLTDFLDDVIPVIAGCEINDNPFAPICRRCRDLVAEKGDQTPIDYWKRQDRYVEKLATPDVTIADIIGDIDPIKAAKGGHAISSELSVHYGLLPRANRGIFAINELPDLAGKIQVGLFNIMQEGDIQIKGYPVRLPLDVSIVFSANPEDYTARGKIVTPLKDRIGSEIKTHYPVSIDDGVAITEQEAWLHRSSSGDILVPRFIRQVVEAVAFKARADQRIDKRSGVSQRLPISCLENVVSNAERRAIRFHESEVVARVADVYSAIPAITGKLELEYEGELKGAETVARDLIRQAMQMVFRQYFPATDFKPIIDWFEMGGNLKLSDVESSSSALLSMGQVNGLLDKTEPLGVGAGASAGQRAAAAEFILEGLHAIDKITRTEERGFTAHERTRQQSQDLYRDYSAEETGTRSRSISFMATAKYTKWIKSPLDGLSLEELLDELSEFLLQSGFHSQFGFGDEGNPRDLDALRQAIVEKLVEMGRIPESLFEQWMQDRSEGEAKQLDELVDQLVRKLIEEGWIQSDPEARPADQGEGGGGTEGLPEGSARFEITDKSIDFLGFRLLRHLLGSLGRSSFGRHETAHFATGVEANQSSKPYEFGDTLNLDISATLLSAIAREGLHVPINLEHQDLMVRQSEYESSCSTVLLLDTSHSMILYGEDRFTPAKRVALALAHLIRTQYPGDSLRLCLFHDSAEEIPLKQLARVVVGPYHTNTCEGLRLARRLLMSDKKDMRQIIMITDGKPSAITLPNGRIYKNAFGLDPMILEETFNEVATCRKAGIMINTFMLASDRQLVDFVKKVTEICRGKAYFTSTVNLGQYVLMDYLRKKVETIH